MTESSSWLSCHVFHYGDTDPLLTGLVLPMTEDLLSRGRLLRYFFLRHWERGPHVRVRLKVGAEYRDEVQTHVDQQVAAYLRKNPGPDDTDSEQMLRALRRNSELEHGHSRDEQLWTAEPPNTMRWIAYQPEMAKYGGPEGVAIAEDIFHTSSLLAGQVLLKVDSDRARLGVALQFLLLASRALGLAPDERAIFLRTYRERWSPYVTDERLMAAWSEQYQLQRDTYASMLTNLDSGAVVGARLGQEWERALTNAIGRLRPLVESGCVWPTEVAAEAPTTVALAALVSQYLHTTNNRMNVRPQGECFVAYLAHRAAEESSQNHGGGDR